MKTKMPQRALCLVVLFGAFVSPAFATSTGDVNGDGEVNVADIFYFINFLFSGGPDPAPRVQRDILSMRVQESPFWESGRIPIHLPHGATIIDVRVQFAVAPYMMYPNRCTSATFLIEFGSFGFGGLWTTQPWSFETVGFDVPPEENGPLLHHVTLSDNAPLDNANYLHEISIAGGGCDGTGSVHPSVVTIEYDR
jgi:hypothetical protein